MNASDFDTYIDSLADYGAELFKQGYYCSEAVVLVFEKATDTQVSDDIKRGMTSFVEGLGSTGCVCGALNAAVFMLSTKLGRTDSSSSSKNAEKSAASIVNAFKGEHGSTCCRVITKKASKVFGIGRYSTCPACVRTALRAMLKELHSENLLVIK